MLIVTTISYDQLSALIRDKEVSLDNADLILGANSESIRKYMSERLGSSGYVMGIRGRINSSSVELLSQLDEGLSGNRVVLESDVDDDDVIAFDVKGLDDVVNIMAYGLPEEMLFEQLDNSIIHDPEHKGITVVCTPAVKRDSGVRITSINRDIDINAEGITFVRLGETQTQ